MSKREATPKEIQIEVVKYLKTKKDFIAKLDNKYQSIKNRFEAKYEGEDGYECVEAKFSKKHMIIQKLDFFKEVVDEFRDDNLGAKEILSILEGEITATRSQLYNRVTDEFGMSQDTAVFTQDDLDLFKSHHYKDFHIFVISMMNPIDPNDYENTGMSLDEKYEIYENPELYFNVDENEEIVIED